MGHIPAENTVPTRKNIFQRMYQGELSLPVTFWIFGAVGTALLASSISYFTYVLTNDASMQNTISTTGGRFGGILLLVPFLCIFAYIFMVSAGQWRAADRYQGKQHWAILAKACVLLWPVVIAKLSTYPVTILVFFSIITLTAP